MALDWITGSWAARSKGEWSSSVARAGLWHKLGEIVALLVAALCDIAIQVVLNSAAAPLLQGFEYGNYMTLLVAVWYIFTELGSIIENAGALGAPIPKWLRRSIAVLQQKADAADPVPKPPDAEELLQNIPQKIPVEDPAPAAAHRDAPAAYEQAAEAAADPDPDSPALAAAYRPKHAGSGAELRTPHEGPET